LNDLGSDLGGDLGGNLGGYLGGDRGSVSTAFVSVLIAAEGMTTLLPGG